MEVNLRAIIVFGVCFVIRSNIWCIWPCDLYTLRYYVKVVFVEVFPNHLYCTECCWWA